MTYKNGTAQNRYAELQPDREPYVNRARDLAKLTIPSTFPQAGTTGSEKFDPPYQGIGARGVNNLAAKLLLSLLPPGTPPFRLSLEDDALAQAKASDAQEDAEKALSEAERRVVNRMEQRGIRPTIYRMFKRLIIGGNDLLYVDKKGSVRSFRLDQYVVVRNERGEPVEIVTVEKLHRSSLPDVLRQLVNDVGMEVGTQVQSETDQNRVDLYTHVKIDENRNTTVYQECLGKIVPESEGAYSGYCPWLPLRWEKVDGEHYGRSHCEEYWGDLLSFDSLSASVIDLAAIAAKVIFFTPEGSLLTPQKLANAKSGAVMRGNGNEVTRLQVDKLADMQVAASTAERIEMRLAQAFLLTQSIQRQAERVTAEEIRLLANELEQGLGGAYSVLAQEFLYPLAKTYLKQMERSGELPSLDKIATPKITTGFEGLGRTTDLQKLDMFIGGANAVIGQDVVAGRLNSGEYLKRRATALGIDAENLILSDDQVAAQQQQALSAEIAKTMAGKVDPSQNPQQTANAPA